MMRKIFTLILACLAALSGFYSCKHQPDENIVPIDTTQNNNAKRPCSPDTAYFEKDVQTIFKDYCYGSGCHNGNSPADGVNLNSYSDVMATGSVKAGNSTNSKMYRAVTGQSDQMPPSGKMPDDKIAMIKRWIDQGAKNLKCGDMLLPCDTITVTYSKTISGILDTYCYSCHGTSGSGGVTLTNYSGVKSVINDGRLWNAVNHLSGPQKAMPNSTTKLSDCNLKQIKKWMDAGAPQN